MRTILSTAFLAAAIAVISLAAPAGTVAAMASERALERRNELAQNQTKKSDDATKIEQQNNGKAPEHAKNDKQAEAAPQHQGDQPVKTDTEARLSVQHEAKQVHNPAGNNGFIKVNSEEVPDSVPNNDPHVPCVFKVEFYNYDKNDAYRAQVNFQLHSPTKGDGYGMTVNGNTNVFIGHDEATGGNDLDAVETYRLTFTGAPHAQQGYHVKLTIHADGSRGSDVKHKVFWVEPCQPGSGGGTTTPQKPQLPQETGQTLSTTTNAGRGVLPASLPSTGQSMLALVFGIIATVLTYGGTLSWKLRAQRAQTNIT